MSREEPDPLAIKAALAAVYSFVLDAAYNVAFDNYSSINNAYNRRKLMESLILGCATGVGVLGAYGMVSTIPTIIPDYIPAMSNSGEITQGIITSYLVEGSITAIAVTMMYENQPIQNDIYFKVGNSLCSDMLASYTAAAITGKPVESFYQNIGDFTFLVR